MLCRSAQEHWDEAIQRIEHGRPFSSWLTLNLRRALALPPEQAARDAEILAAILRGRLGRLTAGDPLAPVPLPAHDPLVTRATWERSIAVAKNRRRARTSRLLPAVRNRRARPSARESSTPRRRGLALP